MSAPRPSIRRMHFNEDGTPKKALNKGEAAHLRRKGKRTFLCPLCGACHAGGTS